MSLSAINNADSASSVRGKINDAIAKVNSQDTDITALQADVSALQSDVSTLQSDMSTAQSDITSLQGSIAGKQDASTVSTLKYRLKNETASRSVIASDSNGVLYFRANAGNLTYTLDPNTGFLSNSIVIVSNDELSSDNILLSAGSGATFKAGAGGSTLLPGESATLFAYSATAWLRLF